jgi:tRNA (cmo5U34)-methyltransferase
MDREVKSSDNLVVPADWTFKNANVAQNFDQHVREQLPWYELATAIATHFGRHYMPENGLMYDLGASTGNITKALRKEIELRKVTAISIDNSAPMEKVFQGVGRFELADIREYAYQPYDFCTCFLVLMFLSREQQISVVNNLVDQLKPGGALVIFDKTDDFDGYLSTVVHRLALAGKVATGVPSDAIVKKELSLAGVQRPIDSDWLMYTKGAKEIFRFGEFAGWVITKR